MKYLIVGLGNMGSDYEHTRHNIGFEVVDSLAREFKSSFKHESLGDLTFFKYKSRFFYLLKPSTYMNRSGKAVRYWMQKLKIPKENCLIVVDDFQLPLGLLRLRKKGSDGGHNGLRSIQDYLQTNQYPRLRLGIGNDFHKDQQVDFVLGSWTEPEKDALQNILEKSGQVIKSFGTIGIDRTMNQFN